MANTMPAKSAHPCLPATPYVMAAANAELDDYFARGIDPGNVGRQDIEVNLVDHAGAIALTASLLRWASIGCLGGIVLDEPGNSNHHAYLTRAPYIGAVLFWQHDDGPYVAFASLTEYLGAVGAARARRVPLTSLHTRPFLPDQPGLVRFIGDMLDNGSERALCLAHEAIFCVKRFEPSLLTRLIEHKFFFFGETVGYYIARYPDPALRPFALMCNEHPHHQVRWAGERALKALNGLA